MLPPDQWFVPRHDAADASVGLHVPAGFSGARLFAASSEPMLIVEALTGAIVEANPPAAAFLNTTSARLIGTQLPASFEAASAGTIDACLIVARELGSAESASVRAVNGGFEMNVRISLVRGSAASYLLVRLTSNSGAGFNAEGTGADSVVMQTIDGAPSGFLMTDRSFRIEYANRVFIEMIDMKAQGDVCGSSLVRWLDLTEADMARLSQQLSQRQAVSLLTTGLRSHRNRRRQVEVCAVAVPAGDESCWGFTVSELPRLN